MGKPPPPPPCFLLVIVIIIIVIMMHTSIITGSIRSKLLNVYQSSLEQAWHARVETKSLFPNENEYASFLLKITDKSLA